MAILGDDIAASDIKLLPRGAGRPNAPLRGDQLEEVAKLQAYLQQYMTDAKLSSGAWAGTPQKHNTDQGCPLGWPLSVSEWPAWLATTSTLDSASFGTEVINCDLGTLRLDPTYITSGQKRRLLRFPFYLPAGNTHVHCYIRASGYFSTMSPTFALLDTSFVTIAGQRAPFAVAGSVQGLDLGSAAEHAGDNSERWFKATLTYGTAGEKIAEVAVTLGDTTAHPPVVDVWECIILPTHFYNAAQQDECPVSPVTGWSNSSNILTASSYTNTYATWLDANRPLTSKILTDMAKNTAYLYEMITGSPVAGKSSLTAAAHYHDGTTTPTFPLPLFARCLGYVPSAGTATAGDLNTWRHSVECNYGCAPTTTGNSADNTTQTVMHFAVYVPNRTGTVTATWGASLYLKDGHSPGGIDVEVYSGSTPDATTNTSSANISGTGWKHATDTHTVTANAVNHFTVKLKVITKPATAGNWNDTLSGFALWLAS